MQKVINSVLAEIKRVVSKPPSRPIRVMFFETPMMYGIVQNRVKEEFEASEIININSFFKSQKWMEDGDIIAELEVKYGNESSRFQRKLCETLEGYIIDFINSNNAKKILFIEDEALYINGFDPIHFLSAYMFDHYLILEKEIPIIWLTVGQKVEYSLNEYKYYMTDTTTGRTIKITQDSFRSCVFDYKYN